MYVPLMPVLLWFPFEVKILKREHFNKWYDLGPYYLALTVVSIPVQMILTLIYIAITYTLTDQPMEADRIIWFYIVCILTVLVAESFGLLVGSVFSIVNALFLGTVIKIPMMLLATYGFGSGAESIPGWIRISMYFSYLRYSVEGLMSTMLKNRSIIPCPEQEEWCIYTDVTFFLKSMGMENAVLWIDITALLVFYLFFKVVGFYLLKQRLSPNRLTRSIHAMLKLVKSKLN
ncbi:hypothetical protein HHI36_010278 [Cryptolaemus montrouzieri]|uniref:ABC-2 type transporter transmembrane domain-containing protein n=1 Tax=Cryptolaemus montrouzieri TaxID=559131 RepID=A0ABD2MI97_9CUCU